MSSPVQTLVPLSQFELCLPLIKFFFTVQTATGLNLYTVFQNRNIRTQYKMTYNMLYKTKNKLQLIKYFRSYNRQWSDTAIEGNRFFKTLDCKTTRPSTLTNYWSQLVMTGLDEIRWKVIRESLKEPQVTEGLSRGRWGMGS